jgi:hypothetical protein
MARRHTTGFEALGLGPDPTPGDPEALLGQLVPTYNNLGDDAATASEILSGKAVKEGRGEAIEKLREQIGSKYPNKLRQTADSFHGAANAYRSYAQTLAQAQTDIDRAMDQALPVASLAAETLPTVPQDANADERITLNKRTSQINEAQSVLSGARRLAADAKGLRDQAAQSLRSDLEKVAVVPARTAFQKFLEFFKKFPVLQILLAILVAVVTIFFPVIGFALGALTFALLTTFQTLATGKFDIGGFVVGLLTLGFGGGMAAVRLVGSVGAKVGKVTSSAGKFVTQIPGPVGPGIKNLGIAIRQRPALEKSLKAAAEGFVPGAVINSIGGGINQAARGEKFNAAAIFGGAAAGAAIGAAGAGVITKLTKPVATGVATKIGPTSTQSTPTRPPSRTNSVTSAPPASPVQGSSTPPQVPSRTSTVFETPPTSPAQGSSTPPTSPAQSSSTPTSASTVPNTPPGNSVQGTPASSTTSTTPITAAGAADELSLKDRIINTGVVGASVGADGGAKVGIQHGQDPDSEVGGLVGTEGVGSNAGVAAGGLTNRKEPINKGSFGRFGR